MAEIEIRKKKPVWPWIILVLIILAILYFVVFDNDDNDFDNTDDTELIMDDSSLNNENEFEETTWEEETMNDTLAYTGAGVAGFASYIGDESKMGVDHEYTNTALLYLIDAVREKATLLNMDVSNKLEQVREDAQAITQNPESLDHAGTIKDAGTQIVDIFENMQQQQFPDLSAEVEQVRAAVEKIDPSVQTLEQKDAINSFFNEAADVLQKMK